MYNCWQTTAVVDPGAPVGAKQNQSHASARQTLEAEEFERDGLEVVLPEKPQVAVTLLGSVVDRPEGAEGRQGTDAGVQ